MMMMMMIDPAMIAVMPGCLTTDRLKTTEVKTCAPEWHELVWQLKSLMNSLWVVWYTLLKMADFPPQFQQRTDDFAKSFFLNMFLLPSLS